MKTNRFRFLELTGNAPIHLCALEMVIERIRRQLNIIDGICPGYEGITGGVQKIIRDIRNQIMPRPHQSGPDISEIFRTRQSMNFCMYPLVNCNGPLENLFKHNLRYWHELRTYATLAGSKCKTSREAQRKTIERYFKHIDDRKLAEVFEMYADDVQYSRITFQRQGTKITGVNFPPFGDIIVGPRPIMNKAEFIRYYEQGRDMSGSHTISYLVSGAHGWVISEGSYEGRSVQSGENIRIPKWRDIVRFNKSGKIQERYSLIVKDE